MRQLDIIYHKRLKRIRQELNYYIEVRLPREDVSFFSPMVSGVPEEKKRGSIQEKFLSYHLLKDSAFDDSGYWEDSDEYTSPQSDESLVPSKKTAISFCLALQLEMDEAKKLLATAGYTLSMSSKFDLIIMYLIENCEYSIHFANIVLDDYGVGTLSK